MSVADWLFCCAAHNAWPAVSAELAESREQMELLDGMKDGVAIRIADLERRIEAQDAELATLREFARRVQSYKGMTALWMKTNVLIDLDWLDAETKKAGD